MHWNARLDASELDMWGTDILEYIDDTLIVEDGEEMYEKLLNSLEKLGLIE